MKPTTLPLGTISEGTLRTDDLVETLIDALSPLRLSRAERATVIAARKALQAYHEADRDDADSDAGDPITDLDYAFEDLRTADLDYAFEDLRTMADAHCPDYAYFGSLDGDGACFGVWPILPDADDVPHGDSYANAPANADHFLEVNDHGNCTLYRRAGKRWIEVWSVV